MSGWIGVDFDGTLCEYHGWKANGERLGKPIPLMVNRVKKWIKEGKCVKIMTARAEDKKEVAKIEKWCYTYIGVKLEVTNKKDYSMIELWDDRAIRVEFNTGKIIGEKQR